MESKISEIRSIKIQNSDHHSIHVSELAKSQQPNLYILNPNTGRYVKRATSLGKKLTNGGQSEKKNNLKFKINKVSKNQLPNDMIHTSDEKTHNVKINLIKKNQSIKVDPEIKVVHVPSSLLNLANKGVIYIYTDGAVSNNQDSRRSVGGIGVFFGFRCPFNLAEKFLEAPVTNQRAELWAIIRAFQIIIQQRLHCHSEIRIVIYSDSMYAINIITKQWRAQENLDLTNIAWQLLKQIPNLELKHIRAHTRKDDIHSQGNAMADELARQGRNQ